MHIEAPPWRRNKRQASLSTGSSSDASMQSLLSSLEHIRPGSLFYGKYLVEQGVHRGLHTAMIFGHVKDDPSQEVQRCTWSMVQKHI